MSAYSNIFREGLVKTINLIENIGINRVRLDGAYETFDKTSFIEMNKYFEI